MICLAGGARATVIAYDLFEDGGTDPRPLNNWDGGAGWGAYVWDAGSNANTSMNIVSANLTRTVYQDDGLGGTVAIGTIDGGDRAVRIIGGATTGSRRIATANMGQTYYISFLYQFAAGTIDTNDRMSLEAYDLAGNPNPWWGQWADANGNELNSGLGTDRNILGPAAGNSVHLIVGRAVWDGVSRYDTFDLWVDPVLTSGGGLSMAPGSGGYIGQYIEAGGSGAKPQGVDGFRIRPAQWDNGDTVFMDELRVGTTVADVIVVIPEPAVATLSLFALLPLLRRRR